MFGDTGFVFEVVTFLFNNQGAVLDEGMDGTDVFTNDAETEELDGGEEEETDDERGGTDGEAIPEEELVDETAEGCDHAEEAAGQTGEGDDAERDLGQVGDAQHGHVIERVEVVLGNAFQAAWLVEEDLFAGEADFRDHAAEVRVRIFEGLDDFADLAIKKPKAGEVLIGLNVRHAIDHLVVLGADPEHQLVFIAGLLDAEHHLKALFPVADHFGNEFGRVLQIGNEADDGIAGGLAEGVMGGADVAEVARIGDDFDVGVFQGNLFEDFQRSVG